MAPIPMALEKCGDMTHINVPFFCSCSLVSRSSAAMSGHASPTQTKPDVLMALCTGMFWKIRNLQTVVLTTGSIKALHLEEHPMQDIPCFNQFAAQT